MSLSPVQALGVVAAAVTLINIPFGFWRAGARKFSLRWFLAVHLPVPVVVGLRMLANLGWGLLTFGVLIAAFFLGQLLGGLIRRLSRRT